MQIDTSVHFYENHLMVKNYFISSCCDLFRHLFYIYYRLLADNGSVNRKINNLTYADDTTPMAKSKEELKSLLMKEESESTGLTLSIQKTKIMASSPINSWQVEGEKMETVTDFIFLSHKKSLWTVTAAMKLNDACSLEEML